VATAAAGISLEPGAVASAQPGAAADLQVSLVWRTAITADHRPFALSSPVVVDLPGGPAAVAGDRSGHVYAIYLKPGARGGPVRAWTVTTPGAIGVDSSPSAIGGVVYFGVGWAGQPGGGYEAVNPTGKVRWFRDAVNPPTDPTKYARVAAGLTIGSLQSETALVGPSLGQNTYAFNASSGARLKGFPWFQGDTNFSTAAVADVEGNGRNQIVEGGNTTAGFAFHTQYVNGGQIRILEETGDNGHADKPGAAVDCKYQTDQGVDSSPAVGDFLNGRPGIVVGTSTERKDVSTTDDLIAINGACHKVWKTTLDGATTSSPALADVLGNGQLQVVEGTENGYVYALTSLTGKVLWRTHVPGSVIGGVVTADFGNGHQDVIVPSTSGAYILDGRSGKIVKTLESFIGLQNSPLVTDDPNGRIGITIAGYSNGPSGQEAVMEHFEILGSNGAGVTAAGAWPEFHHDPQLSGNANVAMADNLHITSKALPAATKNVPYDTGVHAMGGTSPYIWTRIGGTKPPGLTFSRSGTWRGTPTRPGTYHFTVRVTDGRLTKSTLNLTIRVASG
jgi:outer membrane protein assembly factor BamB